MLVQALTWAYCVFPVCTDNLFKMWAMAHFIIVSHLLMEYHPGTPRGAAESNSLSKRLFPNCREVTVNS